MDFSAGSLATSFLVGSIGLVLFVYGKRQGRVPQLAVGLLMLVYPYFVPGPLAMIAIAAGLVLVLVLALRNGY